MATRAIPGSGNMPPSRLPGRWHVVASAVDELAAPEAAPQTAPPAPTPSSESPTESPVTPLVLASYRHTGYAAAGYGPSRRSRLIALSVVAMLHVAAIGALVTHRFLAPTDAAPTALVLLDLPAAPPPPPAAVVPDLVFETPDVVVPPPVIQIAPTAPTITARVAETPPVPLAHPVAEAAPATAASVGPVTPVVADLAASVVHMLPPRYPYESRRLKEQGTVVLDVTLSPNGQVDSVRVRHSSGHARLDRAALEAVRRWRWSPTIRDGAAIAVRGLVEIPFILAPAAGR